MAGDYVLSRDPASKRTEWKRVERTSVRTVAGVVAVHLADAAGHEVESFVCTHDHPFYVDGKGFVPAGKLAIGNAIITRAGPALTVSQIEFHVRPEGYEVYNLVVEADHSYFVGEGEEAAWVHNGVGDCEPFKLLNPRNRTARRQAVAGIRAPRPFNVVTSSEADARALIEEAFPGLPE